MADHKKEEGLVNLPLYVLPAMKEKQRRRSILCGIIILLKQ